MSIRVAEFEFDEDNEAELWGKGHRITDEDVYSVFDRGFILLRNKRAATGTHKMVGRNASGRLLTIVLMPVPGHSGRWRPITGYNSNTFEARKWSER